jgi:hypothetical protein
MEEGRGKKGKCKFLCVFVEEDGENMTAQIIALIA